MPGKTNDTNHHGEDRFSQKLKLYESLHVLPNKVPRAKSAVVLIAAICAIALCVIAEVKAPWFAYLTLLGLAVILCLFAVWPNENAKAKQKQFTGKSPPQPGICSADLRPDASGPAP
ncbi:MAG: hypothetical protein WAO21_03630 [Verrucomicrobiia bacterium]